MPRLFFSLRWRLMLACVLLVIFTAGGMWWFSRVGTLQTTVYVVENALTQLVGLIEEEVRAGHVLSVQAKVNSLQFNRAYLWDEGVQLNATLKFLSDRGTPQQDIIRFFKDWKKVPLYVGTHFAMYKKNPDGSVEDILSGVVLPADPRNKSTAVNNIITKLPRDGLLAVFRDTGGASCLGAFMPSINPAWTIVTYRSMSAVEEGATQVSDAIINRMRQLISGVTILNNGFLAAVDGKGQIQAIHKKAELPTSIINATMHSDTNPTHISLTIPKGDMEYRITYIRPLDWHLIIAVPVQDLKAPANALTARLIKISIIAIVIGVLAAFFMANRIAQPLSQLANLAQRLPAEDILQFNPATISRELPTQRRDEVGDLARSFSYMVHELHQNVTSLVEASAARERLQVELNVAREIQEGILPKIFPPYPDRRELDLFAVSKPAKEVGGDLYDFFFVSDDQLCLVIADVSDKGVPAALYMSITVTLVRVAMQKNGTTPNEALERVNFTLAAGSTKGMFVTLFIGILHLVTGEFIWASGGHPPPFILRQNSIEKPTPSGNLVVGALPDLVYSSHSLHLNHGDALFFYTDGVTEAMTFDLQIYTEQRLQATLARCSTLRMEQLIQEVCADVDVHMDGAPPSDDITMLAVRYMPPQ